MGTPGLLPLACETRSSRAYARNAAQTFSACTENVHRSLRPKSGTVRLPQGYARERLRPVETVLCFANRGPVAQLTTYSSRRGSGSWSERSKTLLAPGSGDKRGRGYP